MLDNLPQYFVAGLAGLIITYLLTPAVRRLAVRLGAVDLPNARRPHKQPTARGGGLAVVMGVHVAYLAALVLPWFTVAGATDFHWWYHFALASLVLLVVGVVDDIRGLSPSVKLAGQVCAALLIALSGTHFGSILGHKLPQAVDCLLVVFWIVAIINAFNLIDGLDGLASGLAIIAAIGLCGVFAIEKSAGNAVVLAALIGSCLGFLRYNFHPATIFLGDTGSMFLGFTLGVVSLQTLTKSTFLLSMTIPMLVFGIPIYDGILAVWRRSVRQWLLRNQASAAGKRFGIMQPDLEHLHHRLLKAGLSTGRVAGLLCVLNFALVGFGLLLTMFQSQALGIFLLAFLAVLYVLLRHLAAIELHETGKALLIGLRSPTHLTLKALAYPLWDMLWMAGVLGVVMWFFEEQQVDFWHTWFVELPVWVTPSLSLLATSRTYVVYWPRARLRDSLMLLFWLQTGLLCSLGLAMVIEPSLGHRWLLRLLLLGGIVHPVLIGSRLVYRCIEELVVWLKGQADPGSEREPVLLYGAGLRCHLFLRDRAASAARNPDGRHIVGLIDDQRELWFRWIYGHPVLGGLEDISRLIKRYQVQRIVITAELTPGRRARVCELARQTGIALSEWRACETNLEFPLPDRECPDSTKQIEQHPLKENYA